MKIAKRDSAKHTAQRQVSFGRGETARAVDIVGRSEITSTPKPGPLVIEEFDATIVVPPDAVVSKDQIGCIVVEFSA
jgi:N-methylhydantoinase A